MGIAPAAAGHACKQTHGLQANPGLLCAAQLQLQLPGQGLSQPRPQRPASCMSVHLCLSSHTANTPGGTQMEVLQGSGARTIWSASSTPPFRPLQSHWQHTTSAAPATPWCIVTAIAACCWGCCCGHSTQPDNAREFACSTCIACHLTRVNAPDPCPAQSQSAS
jgi:hypothetical protein